MVSNSVLDAIAGQIERMLDRAERRRIKYGQRSYSLTFSPRSSSLHP